MNKKIIGAIVGLVVFNTLVLVVVVPALLYAFVFSVQEGPITLHAEAAQFAVGAMDEPSSYDRQLMNSGEIAVVLVQDNNTGMVEVYTEVEARELVHRGIHDSTKHFGRAHHKVSSSLFTNESTVEQAFPFMSGLGQSGVVQQVQPGETMWAETIDTGDDRVLLVIKRAGKGELPDRPQE